MIVYKEVKVAKAQVVIRFAHNSVKVFEAEDENAFRKLKAQAEENYKLSFRE